MALLMALEKALLRECRREGMAVGDIHRTCVGVDGMAEGKCVGALEDNAVGDFVRIVVGENVGRIIRWIKRWLC